MIKKKFNTLPIKTSIVPEIDDIKMARWSRKIDEKILEDIIKPKDELINKLVEYIKKLSLKRKNQI